MKKLLIFYISVLFMVFCAGMYIDFRSQYMHERILWNIRHDYEAILARPSFMTRQAISGITDRYEAFIKNNPRSILLPQAMLLLGHGYIATQQYEKARQVFEEVINKYSFNDNILSQAQFAVAQSYEIDNNWAQAIKIYESIKKERPLTSAGFSVPYYIARRYLSQGLKGHSMTAFNDAVEFYENIADNNPNSTLEYSALNMIIQCRLAQENWEEVSAASRMLILKYPAASGLFESVQTLMDACIIGMDNYDCAIGALSEFVQEYDGHPLKPQLAKIIANLETAKFNKLKEPDHHE